MSAISPRTVVITGASAGIGRAGGQALSLSTDVADSDQVDAAAGEPLATGVAVAARAFAVDRRCRGGRHRRRRCADPPPPLTSQHI
jgi:NAD(P)-dependent dehydrogenase (short-subunit alcohol dehydrogenase family)